MADRIISDRCPTSPSLNSCSKLAFFAFPWLALAADHRGRFLADPRSVRSALAPFREDIGLDEVAGWLDEWERNGMIRRWEAGGRVCGEMVTFCKHQKLRFTAKPSRIPDPPESSGEPQRFSETHHDSQRLSENHGESPRVTESLGEPRSEAEAEDEDEAEAEAEAETKHADAAADRFRDFGDEDSLIEVFEQIFPGASPFNNDWFRQWRTIHGDAALLDALRRCHLEIDKIRYPRAWIDSALKGGRRDRGRSDPRRNLRDESPQAPRPKAAARLW